MTRVATECDRFGVSDRCAAAITSALLVDLGVVTESNRTLVVDRYKVRRAREKVRNELTERNRPKNGIFGLYFDGRKDTSRQAEEIEGKLYTSLKVEEHITIIMEPSSTFLGHVTPTNGTASCISNSILQFLDNNHIKTDALVVVGCDGTNVNTGVHGGIIQFFEQRLTKPVHWFVCMLHLNELPLRHIFKMLDGESTSPKAFSGLIGKKLQSCDRMPIVSFKKISTSNLPEVDFKDLSTDQKYLYRICAAVSTGKCSADLAHLKPGPVNHSRWLTMACRTLRLYIATENPSSQLYILAEFILQVYAPVWFSIKQKPNCGDGPGHLLKMIMYSRYLPTEIRSVVDKCLRRNAYFAHTENLLIAMMLDDREVVRKLAIRRILAARNKKKSGIVRKFIVPSSFNLEAKDIIDLINWQEELVYEPPLTQTMSDDSLKDLLINPMEFEIPKFPCHTQAVERSVKMVTEASTEVFTAKRRDGLIHAKIDSRARNQTYTSKGAFKI